MSDRHFVMGMGLAACGVFALSAGAVFFHVLSPLECMAFAGFGAVLGVALFALSGR